MNMHFALPLVIFATTLSGPSVTAQQASEPPPPIRPLQPNDLLAKNIACTVNDRVITREEVDFFLAPIQAQLVAQFPGRGAYFEAKLKEARDGVIRDLIDRQIMSDEFAKLGASIKPGLIDEEIKRAIRDAFNGDEAKFRENIERNGFTLDQYREFTRGRFEMQAIRTLLFTDEPPPSPKEIENEYEEVKASFRDTSKDVISFRKILIPSSNPANPAATPESQLLLAKDLVRQLSEGKDFSELAKSHSTDAFAANGGLQENVPRPDLDSGFASILFEATVGEVLGPLSFPSGFAIVIPVKIEFGPPPPFDDNVRAKIEQRVQHKKTSALYEKWIENRRKRAIIKIQD